MISVPWHLGLRNGIADMVSLFLYVSLFSTWKLPSVACNMIVLCYEMSSNRMLIDSSIFQLCRSDFFRQLFATLSALSTMSLWRMHAEQSPIFAEYLLLAEEAAASSSDGQRMSAWPIFGPVLKCKK